MFLKSNKGFSLVELAIGLAVVTVLVLAVSMSSGLRDNARLQSAVNSVQTLRSAAENYLVSGKINYSGLSVDSLKTAKILPGAFSGAGVNPWGGNFTVAPSADPTRFNIALTNVGADDSKKLSDYFKNNASATDFDAEKKTWSVTF